MIFHSRRIVRVLAGLCLALLASACDLSGQSKAPELPPQDSSWSQLISAHTTGIVSRKSRLRVVFVSDVATKEQVGKSAEEFIKADPSIDGSATFASEREIVFMPKADLQSGRHYRVAVRGKGLLGIPEKLEKYEFVFQVIAQDIDVSVAGLSAKDGNDRDMLLKGSVVTADEEDAARLEKVLAASLAEKPLAIQWQHAGDGRHHDFTVSGIARGGDAQTLKLAWDGDPIGVKNKGTRDIEVPARDVFKVTGIQAVREEQQFVRILFSDNVDPQQNLKGMVRLSKGGYTARVTGNAVALYPDRGLEGDIVVSVEPGVRNTKGGKLEKAMRETVTFASEKPRVRFSGKGVILPDNDTLSVSFEAINVRSVQVTAFRVFENNMGQFLQTNKLDGAQELGRVGRYLWRRTVHLSAPESNKWGRYAFDVTKLFKDNPGGMFRLVVSMNRTGSAFACPGAQQPVAPIAEPVLKNEEDHSNRDVSSWDYAEQYFGVGDDKSTWRDREDPCKNAYYRFGQGVRDARNLIASNIGLLAKRDQRGRLFIVATDLRSAKPAKGVKLTAMNYQNQAIGRAESDGDGFAELKASGTPFYLLAEKEGQKGYLKLTEGTALPVSHFDVGGEKVAGGIKGFIYGERGVWRPGDEIFLTFALQDKERSLPAGHPVTLEFYNPKNQLIQTQTNGSPVGGLYRFALKTADDAPTGDWTAKALLGGTSFTRTVKVETVMPNRLKVELEFGKPMLKASEPLQGKLFGQWLNGATAAGLNADVKARFVPVPTRFERFADYLWDDPAREFSGEPETLFEGKLDAQGYANISHELAAGKNAPGMLSATFTSRVFERGGAFSVSRTSMPYSPFDSYLGIRLPKGDQSRNMLLTDKTHTVELASLSADGKPVSVKNVQVTLYKVEWRWWWDKSGDSLAQYATASHASVVQKNQVSTVNGRGEWKFEIKYPAWGRYLVRACDASGGHCTGQVFYIDWPGWAGRAQEQAGPGANALSFVADKQEYVAGETAKIQLPETSQGRALVSVENGSALIESRWIELAKGRTQFDLPIVPGMSPNVFVSVTLIQPHAEKRNDRPIRLYGVIPIKVTDPATRLKPVLKAADEWAPESKVSVEVSEQNGRAMAYTLAVVDEGLLGLTGFKTPDLHGHFYKREALGVTTWDLFDEVAGAYGGELERLLALGGSDAVNTEENKADKKRFPPVVRFLGPFELKARSSAKHEIDLPSYVGSVRVMVVAAKDAAYGSADKSVFVRQPLMILPTVPRVVGPEEEIAVPVSVFVMDPSIRQVELKIEPGEYFEAVGGDSTSVAFARPDEKLGMLKLRVKSKLGKGTLRFSAVSGSHRAKAEVHIDVRSANPPTTRFERRTLRPGESWDANIVPHGIEGTNVVSLEVSAVPPLDLERRLDYLIRYPHGCVEQVTSSAFPQVYLPALVKLEDGRRKEIERNVHAAIDRLRGFQVPSGAFAYWPGGIFAASAYDARNAWSTNYVGHFLLEAERAGYKVPGAMLADWAKYQKTAAGAWTAGGRASTIEQAYRLYTLAQARQADVGAMNRLRENPQLTGPARWMLAAGYKLAGMNDAAAALVKGDRAELRDYAAPDDSFGSRLRDAAIILSAAVVLGRDDVVKPLVDQVSGELASERWHSTHAVSLSLMAMSKFVGGGDAGSFSFERQVGTGTRTTVKVKAAVHTEKLNKFPTSGSMLRLSNNSERTLFASIVTRGVAKQGEETASSSGLKLEVSYVDAEGKSLDVAKLRQGQDFVATLSVTNSAQTKIDNIALTQIVASGWEIHNVRLAGEADKVESSGGRRRGHLSQIFEPGDGKPDDAVDYLDIRDDRSNRYFGLRAGETKRFRTQLNAAYLGRYYLPGIAAEAMYDATRAARVTGRWVEVVAAGQ